jgi:micrococcal nuclease
MSKGSRNIARILALFIVSIGVLSRVLWDQKIDLPTIPTNFTLEDVLSESFEGVPSENTDDQLFLVTKVIDGDTFQIASGEKVRLIGIDTPESTIKKECFGKESSDYLKQLIDQKYVKLEKDISETDKFDRLLRYVYIDQLFVNKTLVENGYATIATYPPDVAHVETFLDSQRLAQENNLGLWNSCVQNK